MLCQIGRGCALRHHVIHGPKLIQKACWQTEPLGTGGQLRADLAVKSRLAMNPVQLTR